MKSEKILGIVLIFIIAPVLAVLLLSTLTVSPSVQDNNILEYNSNWKFSIPATGESGIIELPAALYVPKNTPVRLTNTLPDYDMDNPALFFITQQQKVTVYLDNELIYDYGSSLKKFGWSPGNSFHFIPLGDKSENRTITIELSSAHNFFSGLVNGFSIGSRDALMLNLIKKDILPLIISLLVLLFGMMLFFLFSVMCLSHINGQETFYLSMFALSTGFWLTSERILVLLFFNDPVFNINVAYISMYLLPVPLLLYIKSICRPKRHWILVCLAWSFVAFVCLTTILQLLGLIDYISFLPVFHILAFTSAACVFYIFFKETWKEKRPPFIFMYSCLALAFLFLLDMILFYISDFHRINHLSYFQIGILLFVIVNIGSLNENLFHIRDMNIKNRLLLSLAYTDTLTRLKNRTSFDEMMNALNLRLAQESSVHLIILDVNNLKTINDTYGHKYGDNILVESAKILKATLGQLGEVYRIGGDEFACIIRNAEESVVKDCVSEMFGQVDRYNAKNEIKMSIAYGMASYHAELDKDIHSLFVRADKAMYNNKETQKVIQVVE